MLCDKIRALYEADQSRKFYLYCYTLGKEEVFINLAKQLDTRIMLLKDRWNRMKAIGLADPGLFTIRELEKDSSLDVEKPYIFTRVMASRPDSKEQIDKHPKAFHFVMTGWKGQYNVKHPNYFKIPYSSHSSKQELADFVKALKPRKLIFNLRQFEGNPRA